MKRTVAVSMVLLLLIGALGLYSRIEPARSEPWTWIVDDDGPADFNQIQEAINAAGEGDTVSIRAGVYYEEVLVNRSISLVGENRETTIINGNGTQYVLSIQVQRVSIAGLAVTNATAGIRIETNNCTISNVKVFGTYVGVWTYESANCVIEGSLIFNQTVHRGEWEDFGGWGILLESSWLYGINQNIFKDIEGAGLVVFGGVYVSADNNFFNGTNIGISLQSSSNNSVSANSFANNECGIYLDQSINSSVSGNMFIDGGLAVYESYANSVENNTVNGRPLVYLEDVADHGVEDAGQVVLVRCDRIRIEGLNLSRTSVGVELWATNNTIVSGNTITNNSYHGAWLDSSFNNSMSGNNITNNGIFGIVLSSSLNNSISRNDIANSSDGIWLGYSSNYNSMSGNDITGNRFGIELDSSSNNSINGNNIIDNSDYGIWLLHSSNSSISGNTITNSSREGIMVSGSSNNSITGNIITNNRNGIYLGVSSHNNISGNTIANNTHGIELGSSSNNTVCHNNLINNTVQAVGVTPEHLNFWDNGYEGNYWSDYNGTDFDEYGIGHDPYAISKNNTDRCPLMNPYVFGDVNHDTKVNIVDISIIARAFGTQSGDINWNPHADLDENGRVNIVDISKAAKEFGKEWRG